MRNIAIVGATGGIGLALVHWYAERWPDAMIWASHRTPVVPQTPDLPRLQWVPLSLESDRSLEKFAESLGKVTSTLDLLILCTGWLHDDHHMPEKSVRDLSSTAFERSMRVNAIAPLLLVSQLEPLLVRGSGSRDARCRIVFLSAKVGSISDNSLGGWHAYRMAKAALNMGVRNLGIEFARSKRKPLVVAVHPGTTHSALSKPFAKSRLPVVGAGETAKRLGKFVEEMTDAQQGQFFHWDGTPIPF